MDRVYLDHNATTPIRPEAREALIAALDELGGNASSVHSAGRLARQRLDEARERVAGALGVPEEAVVFTSGGTESNNLALFGALQAAGPAAGLVTTTIEHSSVLEPARHLEASGHPVAWVPVDGAGRPAAAEVVDAVAAGGARLVSVMAANNEVGSLGPLAEIGAGLAALPAGERPLFHTDAVQALGRVPLALGSWGVDLATLSAHKVGGPLGLGVLVRRAGTPVCGLLRGGGQEDELRPGTENVPAACAAAVAIELAVSEQREYARRTEELSRVLWREVHRALPDAELLGPPLDAPRLPNTLNILIPETDGRVLVTRLDIEGLEVSAGSACASGALEPSHVLLAMGCDDERARRGLRVSLGRTTTEHDIHNAVDALRKTFEQPRKCSRRTD